ncbi:hypothetical protein NMY22_g10940 [Coprinellus aureogranulatus]|nr:hypothetical protein NMY22_g10940 [Coprinellus aureogranulatus]
MNKLFALVSLALFFTSCSAVAVQPSPVEAREPTPVSRAVEPSASDGGLQKKIYAKGKLYFGACADPGTLNNNANANILKKDFGQVTPENSMKWDATEPSRGNFNFGNADTLVNWATSNGKLIRGHTLVWHSQLPGWVNSVNDRNTLTQVIQNHATTVAGRYAGKIYAVSLF